MNDYTIFFSGIKCPNVSQPIDGLVSQTWGKYLDVIVYTCQVGFEFSPNGPFNKTRQCNASRQWTEPEPICQRMYILLLVFSRWTIPVRVCISYY